MGHGESNHKFIYKGGGAGGNESSDIYKMNNIG